MFNIISHCRKYSEPIIESEEKILWHSTKNKLFKYFTRTLIFRHSTWRWSIVGLGREEEIWVENLTQFYQSSTKQNLWTSALEEEEGNKPARNTEHDLRFSWKHFLPRHLRDSTQFFYHFRRKKIFEMKKEKLKKIKSIESRPEFLFSSFLTSPSRQTCNVVCCFEKSETGTQRGFTLFNLFFTYISSFEIYVNSTNNQPHNFFCAFFFFLSPHHQLLSSIFYESKVAGRFIRLITDKTKASLSDRQL